MKRIDFFDYYKMVLNSEIEMDEDTFKVYKDLLYEAQEFFRKEDKLDGSIYYKTFTMLYIEENAFDNGEEKIKYKGIIDCVSHEATMDPKTLFKHRFRFDNYALITLEERGFQVIPSGENRPMKIVKSMR